MDYFTELLDSYSRLKKRSLVLLEAEKDTKPEPPPQPEQSMDDVLALVKNVAAPSPTSIAKRVNSQNKEVDVQVYQKQPEGHWVGLNATPKGRATIVDPKGNPTDAFQQWYDRNFGKGQTTPTDTVTDEDINRPGRQFETVGLVSEDLNTNISEMLKRVTRMVEIAKLLPGFKDQAWTKGERTASYVTGITPQSMERKLAHGSVATIDPEEGFQQGPLSTEDNLDLLVGATHSMNQFLAFGTNDVTDDNKRSRCRQLELQVRRKGKKYVFHSFGNMQEGVVMKNSDLLDFAAERVEEMCGEPLKQVPRGSLEGDWTEQQLSDFRGTGLEVTFAGAAFFPSIEGLGLDPDKKDSIVSRFGKYTRKKILSDESKFVQAMKWARTLVKSGVATDADSDFTLDAILSLGKLTDTPEGLRSFFSTAFALEEAVVDIIKPDMSIPTGTQIGAGYKDDLKYVYFDHSGADESAEDRAQFVADRLGLTDAVMDPIQKYTIKELKELNPELVSIYQDAYDLSDDDNVLVVGSSIKSYHDDSPTKAGEIKDYWRRSGLVRGTVTKDIAPGFEDVCQKRLGFTPQDLEDAIEYQKELDDIYTTLDDILPTELTAQQTRNGLKQVDFDTAWPIIQKRLGRLPDDSKIKAQVAAIFGGDEQKRDINDPASRRKLKEELARLMVNAKQGGDCKQRDASGDLTDRAKKARKNLAYTVQLAGGSLYDTAMNKKVLRNNSVKAGSHQEPINRATQGILDSPDEWDVELDSRGSSLRLRKRDTQQSVTLGTKRKKRGAGKAYSGTNSSVFVSNELTEETSTIEDKLGDRSKLDKDKVEDSLIVNFLQGQAKLLEELLINRTS